MPSLNQKICSVEGCERNSNKSNIYCYAHEKRIYANYKIALLAPIRPIIRHGMCRHVLYNTWLQMKGRCLNPNRPDYKNYGGRGISICERWNDFRNFVTDMGEKPTPLHTLERKNNDGGYSPENCRWATRKEQAQNRRRGSDCYQYPT